MSTVLQLFHVGIVVADLDAAMAELGPALGADWAQPRELRLGERRGRATMGHRDGPPYVELLEGEKRSPWHAAGANRIDHLGYWTEDVTTEKERLREAGMEIELDGADFETPWWTYQVGAGSGVRIELVDATRRAGLLGAYGIVDG